MLLIIATTTLNINYQETVIAQITPTAKLVNGGIAQDTDGDVTPSGNNNTKVAYPITPSMSPSSNISENAETKEKEYTITPEDAVSEPAEESLVERIFDKVNEDLIASGITGFYP